MKVEFLREFTITAGINKEWNDTVVIENTSNYDGVHLTLKEEGERTHRAILSIEGINDLIDGLIAARNLLEGKV